VVDFGRHAITGRLRELSRLLAERGFVSKQIDMSLAAVTARVRTMASLSNMCRRLAAVGPRLRGGGDVGIDD
jgi:hypothetical protein